ncbi:hypothetical protein VaNZ11_012496 [Volvox africanus]|uniref:Uncharacterized protein n=1 Tax=Volvox africanus TaxID=51714 RepID=A0ABQ5SF94_9CHLO|nr:hypothetical protein VaNZ11_012496 [Volvox africanus]
MVPACPDYRGGLLCKDMDADPQARGDGSGVRHVPALHSCGQRGHEWSLTGRRDISIHAGLNGAGELSAFLSQPREPHAHVRWIHVDGLNWEVIQALALKFDLHPLALEDTVHVPQRIKADFYDSCLYVALIYLYLAGGNGSSCEDDTNADPAASSNGSAGSEMQPTSDSSSSRSLPRTISIVTKTEPAAAAIAASSGPASKLGSTSLGGGAAVAPRQLDLEDDGGFFERHQSRALNPGPMHWPLPLRHGAVRMAPPQPFRGCGGATGRGDHGSSAAQEPSDGAAVSIHISAQQVSLFLLRGDHPNTLITIFQSDGSRVVDPILEQLKEPRTLVREAEDASFLANLVIDTLVDHIFPVVSAYREQLQQYEMDVKGSGLAAAASTRELHAMQRDLRRIDRTIAPLQAVVGNMVVRDSTPVSSATVVTAVNGATNGAASPSVPASFPSPFLSRLTCTYLNDVRDHVATICEDLLSLSAECGDLIGLIFNLTTLQQSQSTQTLAVVSTIFLPITFLAGVYGMNFDTLPELHWLYGYMYFWLASLFIVVVFMMVMQRAGMWSWSGTSW